MLKAGILRGGTGDYYDVSLREGGALISCILENLSDKWKPVDIFIDKEGVWYASGVPIQPADLAHKADVVWNASHPSLSNVLENLNLPHAGTSPFSASLAGSRAMLREHMKQIGVNMPRHIILPLYQEDFDGPMEEYASKKAKEVFEKFGSPWVIRASTKDSAMGVHVAKTFPELVDAILDGVNHKQGILVEELITGKSASIHSVAGFRGDDIYTFPPIGLSTDEKEELINIAEEIYKHLGVTHYLKSDFILHPRGDIYLAGVEFLPDLKKDSHFCQSCESVGAKTHHVVEHILESILDKK